ncbi:MAG TPA: IclR family transcriptional regulator [Kineosporiaceae bacterium]|nr:IclR family transcriptional regulator [Kineosporiaceae bacterium]
MAGGAREPGRSVTSRALAVLGAFDAAHPTLTLTQIARRADLPPPTAHRLVAELEAWQALARRADGSYEIGRRLWRLGLLAPLHHELREVASPFMHDVHAATGDVVHLAVREGTLALYVESVVGSGSVAVVSRAGTRLPLHATGVGKVLLAAAPPEVVEQVLGGLSRITRHTIAEPGRMGRELAETRRRGYARTVEEMTLGACSVAVPVRQESGAVVAALGVVVPSGRKDLARLVPTLQVAAAGIGRSLRPAVASRGL